VIHSAIDEARNTQAFPTGRPRQHQMVEQLTRYLELLHRDCLLAPVGGSLAAQSIAPQARTVAEDRGIRCVVVDYDELRGMPSNHLRPL
jgi:endonuclease